MAGGVCIGKCNFCSADCPLSTTQSSPCSRRNSSPYHGDGSSHRTQRTCYLHIWRQVKQYGALAAVLVQAVAGGSASSRHPNTAPAKRSCFQSPAEEKRSMVHTAAKIKTRLIQPRLGCVMSTACCCKAYTSYNVHGNTHRTMCMAARTATPGTSKDRQQHLSTCAMGANIRQWYTCACKSEAPPSQQRQSTCCADTVAHPCRRQCPSLFI
jgi:hypothetical protein